MPSPRDLTGQRYGRLIPFMLTGRRYLAAGTVWLCRCDCGLYCEKPAASIRSGRSQSCGCLLKEATGQRSYVHGHATPKTKTYTSWCAMVERCNNIKHDAYPRYGRRGIAVCAAWRDSFEAFLADMGERPPGYTIDRIDPDGNYEPGNCRWATAKEQAANRRRI